MHISSSCPRRNNDAADNASGYKATDARNLLFLVREMCTGRLAAFQIARPISRRRALAHHRQYTNHHPRRFFIILVRSIPLSSYTPWRCINLPSNVREGNRSALVREGEISAGKSRENRQGTDNGRVAKPKGSQERFCAVPNIQSIFSHVENGIKYFGINSYRK